MQFVHAQFCAKDADDMKTVPKHSKSAAFFVLTSFFITSSCWDVLITISQFGLSDCRIEHAPMQLVRDREKKLRELLKEARLDRELRQVDVAESLGRPQSYVAKVESGERTLDFIEVLDYCKVVRLDATSLVKELS